MVANFFRATQQAPEAVALYADGPVNETDLHSRHRWLVLSDEAKEFRQRMKTDPFYFDPMIAGWWCWGLCAWIGGGWAADPEHGAVNGPVGGSGDRSAKLTNANGVHAKGDGPKPRGYDRGKGTVPAIYNEGRKVHAPLPDSHRPQLADAYARGRGVHGNDAADHYLSQKRPVIANGGSPTGNGVHTRVDLGTCASRRAWLVDWFGRLRDRLRTVRVCCGDFLRVMDSESVTTRLGVTGIFADPPYLAHNDKGEESRSEGLYATDGNNSELVSIRDRLLAYCLERGSNPKIRICVAYYEGDGYEVLQKHGWEEVAWKTQGGYGNRSAKGKKNARRERLVFSPHCLRGPASLFDQLDAEPDLFPEEQQCANETS